MKTILFTLAVLVAGGYLLNQTEQGNALISKYLPEQKIQQATDNFLTEVDKRIESFSHKQTEQYQQELAKLQQRITELESMLAKQASQQQQTAKAGKSAKPKATQPIAKIPEVVKKADKTQLPKVQPYSEFVNTPPEPAQVKRKKQAKLQDIASRMEQVSVEAIKQ